MVPSSVVLDRASAYLFLRGDVGIFHRLVKMNNREKQALEKELTHRHWYVAQNDELMCDLDSRTLLEIAMKRLERVACFKNGSYTSPAEGRVLFVDSTFLSQSTNDEHYHLVIKLTQPIS